MGEREKKKVGRGCTVRKVRGTRRGGDELDWRIGRWSHAVKERKRYDWSRRKRRR